MEWRRSHGGLLVAKPRDPRWAHRPGGLAPIAGGATDSVGIVTGSGAEIATDQDGATPANNYQLIKPVFGAAGVFTIVSPANPLPGTVSDGTNEANILAGDSGQNQQLVAGGRKEVAFSTTIAQAVASTDVSNYRAVAVQIATQGTGSTVTFQGSNDNVNWFSVLLAASNTLNSAIQASTGATTFMWTGSLPCRYFRLNVTGISAGTTSGTVEFFTVPPTAQVVAVSGIPSTLTSPADASAAGAGVAIWSQQGLYNGATFDRQRSNVTGALIAAGATTTQTNVALTTYNATKLVVVVNITAGSGSVTVAINGSTSSAYSYNLLTSTALTGVAATALRIFPDATGVANLVAKDVVPRNVSVTATVSGTITYGIDYVLGV